MSRYSKPAGFLVAFLIACAAGCRAADDPLSDFDRAAKKVLTGFQLARDDERIWTPADRNPPGSPAALNRRYFLGASEVRFSVVLFPTDKAVDQWLEMRARTRSAWVIYWDAGISGKLVPRRPLAFQPGGGMKPVELPKEMQAKSIAWKSVPKRNTGFPHDVIANRVFITVSGGNHREAKRRDPGSWRRRMDDADLTFRLELLAQRFVVLAMQRKGDRK